MQAKTQIDEESSMMTKPAGVIRPDTLRNEATHNDLDDIEVEEERTMVLESGPSQPLGDDVRSLLAQTKVRMDEERSTVPGPATAGRFLPSASVSRHAKEPTDSFTHSYTCDIAVIVSAEETADGGVGTVIETPTIPDDELHTITDNELAPPHIRHPDGRPTRALHVSGRNPDTLSYAHEQSIVELVPVGSRHDVRRYAKRPTHFVWDAPIGDVSKMNAAITNEMVAFHARAGSLVALLEGLVFMKVDNSIPFVATFTTVLHVGYPRLLNQLVDNTFYIAMDRDFHDAVMRHVGLAIPSASNELIFGKIFYGKESIGIETRPICGAPAAKDRWLASPLSVWASSDGSNPGSPGPFVPLSPGDAPISENYRYMESYRHFNRTHLGSCDVQAPDIITLPPLAFRILSRHPEVPHHKGRWTYQIEQTPSTQSFTIPCQFAHQFVMYAHNRILRVIDDEAAAAKKTKKKKALPKKKAPQRK